MNPIAVLAFLMGIGTSSPEPEPAQEKINGSEAIKEHGQKPPKDQGGTKCGRGGWDHN